MNNRREFPKPVRFEIIKRAMRLNMLCCEGCGLVLGKKLWEIDHTIPEAQITDKSKALTAADGKLLGVDCCHRPKTKIDVCVIAKTVRQRDKALGIRKRSTFPGSKASGWKKPFNRPAERRT